MRVDFYVRSYDGALTIFFKSIEKWLSALPKTGTIIPLASNNGHQGRLKQGAVTDVLVSERIPQIWVGTETSTEDLRDCLIKEGWEEIPLPS
ncbi:MAG: hypothetical protein A3C58_00735 [Candidatus Staskawiczbacteria bacterium RIFCSPHIGHO2_02_FULL_34_10]|uniref:Uncharacterized protein n=1 Tax=Candidatus Staskawiczbacteria bacterium RIFCSPHIGHO2_02_FULL_34_10 TaxID=1802205 RepID=A0A1G2HWZ8_9BACT|nr:MAG: hypothetical protein A3C58_00735 [Candidatus Staskawiczbacteria bacterium RIFCSPHIGHO2_02_FULL_34_10]